jgi:hypothetical protein
MVMVKMIDATVREICSLSQPIGFVRMRECKRLRHLFVEAAKEALLLWDDNKHWLNASMANPGDTRPMSAIRSTDQAAAIKGFYDRNR